MEISKLATNILLELIHMIFIEMNHILYTSHRKYNLKESSIFNNQNKMHIGINLTKLHNCVKELKKNYTNEAILQKKG